MTQELQDLDIIQNNGGMRMILRKKQIISASMLAADFKLSKVGSFQIIEDSITELMGKLQIDGLTVKEKYNAFWVFTKTKVKFIKTLSWNDEIILSSFISFISAAKMNIDVEVKDSLGDLVFHSRTELCALEIVNQRIIRLSMIGVDSSMVENRELKEIEFAKIDEVDLPVVDKVKIKYTNIDFSHHTNNLEYIRLVMNTYSVKEMEEKQIKEMEIIYSNQSYENDVLDIKKGTFVDKDFIVIEKDAKPVVKFEIIY